ncbi:response regulator [Larkinella knui]|uniref:Response regulator n=1 Tax=Larkinella knui TaxID=2025310 RepID=A0A3P1CXH5_9BACT|nr:response regulator [Larkinella knui]RRB18122.1 response regulator [Larkinella knui]
MGIHTQKRNPAQPLKNDRVLVIEDNPDHWVFIQKAMQSSFMEATPVWASTSAEALEYLNDCLTIGIRTPLLIFLDLYLPDKETGWQLLQQIRSLPAPIGYLPIVLLSASNQVEDITRSYDSGVTSYVVKPIDFKDWLESFRAFKEYWWEVAALPNFR